MNTTTTAFRYYKEVGFEVFFTADNMVDFFQYSLNEAIERIEWLIEINNAHSGTTAKLLELLRQAKNFKIVQPIVTVLVNEEFKGCLPFINEAQWSEFLVYFFELAASIEFVSASENTKNRSLSEIRVFDSNSECVISTPEKFIRIGDNNGISDKNTAFIWIEK